MSPLTDPFRVLRPLTGPDGTRLGSYYSLPELEKQGVGPVSRLPEYPDRAGVGAAQLRWPQDQ